MGHISQRDEMLYWLASSLVWLFYYYQAAMAGVRWGWFLAYDVISAIVIVWIGLSESFKANQGERGQDFLRRVVLLGVPLGLAVLIASQVLFWASWHLFPYVIDARTFRNPEFAWQVVNFFLFNGIQVWFWWRMHHHITLLAAHSHE